MELDNAAGIRRGWHIVLLLALTHLLSFADRSIMSVVLEPIKAELRLSDSMLGLLQGTAFGIFYSCAMLAFGGLADRFDRRPIITAALLCWSLAVGWCGLARSAAELFAARAMLGIAAAAFVPAAVSLIAASLPQRALGRGMALFTGGGSLGRPVALIGGGALFGMLAGSGISIPGLGPLAAWRALFLMMAAAGVLWAGLTLMLPEPRRPAAPTPRGGMRDALGYVRRRTGAFATHTGASACVLLVIQALTAWAVAYFMRRFGLTLPQAGAATGGLLLLAGPLGHLSGGALMDLFQARLVRAPAAPVIALSLAGAAVATLGLWRADTLAAALACYAAAGFFATMGAPAGLAGVQLLTPGHLRSRIATLFLSTTALLAIGIGPTLVGILADMTGSLAGALALTVSIAAVMGTTLALAGQRSFAAQCADL